LKKVLLGHSGAMRRITVVEDKKGRTDTEVVRQHTARNAVGGCHSAYLFFVTSFSSHCRALKHKEITKMYTSRHQVSCV
jgi:hypothetical protein